MNTDCKTSVDVNFIRLFFPSPVEERIAVQWAWFLGSFISGAALRLRPETTFTEMFSWFEQQGGDATGFALAVAEELGSDLNAFGDNWDQLTFREFVERVSRVGSGSQAQNI